MRWGSEKCHRLVPGKAFYEGKTNLERKVLLDYTYVEKFLLIRGL
jgi:hypothetical protein